LDSQIRIFLADLTYNTVSLATEVFPLNVGFIASYCNKQFGDRIEITLFKYIDELDKAINDNPPDILGLSNYCWNHKVGAELFGMLKKINPFAVTVWGGPNFPLDMPSQHEFMKQYPQADMYIPVEGELSFANIVERVLECESKEAIHNIISETPVNGVISRDINGNLQYSNPAARIKELDEIPSPYTSGLMDKFFDGKLIPMLQTNRGCPFSCTFCTDGKADVNKVNSFGVERIKRELQYIGNNIPESTHNLYISDLNFGMYEQDLDICRTIRELQTKLQWPKYIVASTGKNRKERVIEAIKILDGTLLLSMSVQSLDENVLTNVKRDNISLDTMMSLAPVINQSNLSTFSEVIVGLPGETYQSHLNTIKGLVNAKIDFVKTFSLMLLMGSELATPRERKKWDFKTKFRVLALDFAKLSTGKKVIETEEIVVGSNTLTFDDYMSIRINSFIVWLNSKGNAFRPLIKFFRDNDIDIFQLYYNQLDRIDQSDSKVQNVFKKFTNSAQDELWDSPEEIEAYYQKDENYQKLLDGEDGTNLLNHYGSVITSECMNEWAEYTFNLANEIFRSKNLGIEKEKEFKEIEKYCKGRLHNIMVEESLDIIPMYLFRYDIKKWLESDNRSLEDFLFEKPTWVEFRFSKEHHKFLKDFTNEYGNNRMGRSKFVKYVTINDLWRNPLLQKNEN